MARSKPTTKFLPGWVIPPGGVLAALGAFGAMAFPAVDHWLAWGMVWALGMGAAIWLTTYWVREVFYFYWPDKDDWWAEQER